MLKPRIYLKVLHCILHYKNVQKSWSASRILHEVSNELTSDLINLNGQSVWTALHNPAWKKDISLVISLDIGHLTFFPLNHNPTFIEGQQDEWSAQTFPTRVVCCAETLSSSNISECFEAERSNGDSSFIVPRVRPQLFLEWRVGSTSSCDLYQISFLSTLHLGLKNSWSQGVVWVRKPWPFDEGPAMAFAPL
jgi:hypothetical protein